MINGGGFYVIRNVRDTISMSAVSFWCKSMLKPANELCMWWITQSSSVRMKTSEISVVEMGSPPLHAFITAKQSVFFLFCGTRGRTWLRAHWLISYVLHLTATVAYKTIFTTKYVIINNLVCDIETAGCEMKFRNSLIRLFDSFEIHNFTFRQINQRILWDTVTRNWRVEKQEKRGGRCLSRRVEGESKQGPFLVFCFSCGIFMLITFWQLSSAMPIQKCV